MNELIIERVDYESAYRIISIRIHNRTLSKLDLLISETNQSRNALINRFIEFCLDNYEIR